VKVSELLTIAYYLLGLHLLSLMRYAGAVLREPGIQPLLESRASRRR
jgi:hypothetical protein